MRLKEALIVFFRLDLLNIKDTKKADEDSSALPLLSFKIHSLQSSRG
ncbi:hypothetical protein SAMN05444673_3478 [Bacillus sp. OV166]|nr:hypothetical protein SAMN05444673_3478 [Bacillus sp. OV166]